jgi:hypothetical protein
MGAGAAADIRVRAATALTRSATSFSPMGARSSAPNGATAHPSTERSARLSDARARNSSDLTCDDDISSRSAISW